MATNRSQPRDRAITAQIVRLKANERQQVFCLSDKLIGTELHFTFRSVPCDLDEQKPHQRCERCDAGGVPRWEGYFLGWSPSNNVTAIYAVSEGNAATFASYAEREGTLRGSLVTMKRGTKTNGKVETGIMKGNLSNAALPSEIDLWKTMNLVWYGRAERPPLTADPRVTSDARSPDRPPEVIPFVPVPQSGVAAASTKQPAVMSAEEFEFRKQAQIKAMAEAPQLQDDPERVAMREAIEARATNRLNGHHKNGKGRVTA